MVYIDKMADREVKTRKRKPASEGDNDLENQPEDKKKTKAIASRYYLFLYVYVYITCYVYHPICLLYYIIDIVLDMVLFAIYDMNGFITTSIQYSLLINVI